MTRLVTCGWETGDVAELGTASGTGSQTVVSSTPTPRSPGTYCLRCGGAGSGSAMRDFALGGAKSDMWLRAGVIPHGIAGEVPLLTLLDSAAGFQGTVTWTGSDSLLRVYRGNSATLLGTSVQQWVVDTWHTLEVRWQITSTTVGIVEVWVDGTRWLNLTAIDNTNTANLNVQTARLGANITFGSTTYVAYDDLAINDTAGTINNGQINDGRVVLLKPSGAGSNAAQTRGGTDTGANWSQCSELPPSLTQYVFSATAATRDTYALEDVPAGSWTINSVEVLAFAQNSDVNPGSLGLTVKSSSTTNEGTAQSLTTTGAYYRQLYETDPATSAAWTVAAVSALEAGTTVR